MNVSQSTLCKFFSPPNRSFIRRESDYCNAKVVIATRKWLLQCESCYCNAKVVIATQKWLLKREFLYRLPFSFSVSDNTFAALNVADFEELTFNYGL